MNKKALLNKYLQQSSSFMARIAVSIISMVLSVIIVRLYDKSIVSTFFLFVSYTTFLTQVVLLGMTPFLNILAASRIRLADIYIEIAKKMSVSIPMTLLVLYVMIVLMNIEDGNLLFLSTIISALSCFLIELMKGNGAYISAQLYNGGISTIIFIVLLICNRVIHYDASVIELYLLSLIISLVLNYYEWERKYRRVSTVDIAENNKIIFKKIMPIYLSTVIVYLFSQIDLWVVSKNFESSIVAQYGLAIRLAALLSFSTLSVRAIAANRIPMLIKNKVQLQKEIYHSCNFSFIVSVFTLLSLLILGYWLIGIVFGSSYQFSWYILIVFSIGQIVNAATGPCDFLLSHTGHGISLMWITIISFIVLVACLASIQIVEIKSVFLYCGVVSAIIALQNISVVYIAYKKTGIIALPCFKRGY